MCNTRDLITVSVTHILFSIDDNDNIVKGTIDTLPSIIVGNKMSILLTSSFFNYTGISSSIRIKSWNRESVV